MPVLVVAMESLAFCSGSDIQGTGDCYLRIGYMLVQRILEPVIARMAQEVVQDSGQRGPRQPRLAGCWRARDETGAAPSLGWEELATPWLVGVKVGLDFGVDLAKGCEVGKVGSYDAAIALDGSDDLIGLGPGNSNESRDCTWHVESDALSSCVLLTRWFLGNRSRQALREYVSFRILVDFMLRRWLSSLDLVISSCPTMPRELTRSIE